MPWLLRLAILSGLVIAQDSAIFRTGVSLVHVDAEVTDGTRLLSGFHKEDFKIFDNGAAQPVLFFSQEETPLDLILLFDVSGSMSPKLEKIARSAHAALAQLTRGDRVAVMTFARSSMVVAPFTEDLQAVERTINEEVLGKARGGTRMLRAVTDAAEYFLNEKRTERRRAVLILTDNHGQPSGKRDAVIRALWEADAVLCGLELRSSGENALMGVRSVLSPVSAMMDMENVTTVVEKTGGDLMKGAGAGADFEEMIRRIRLRYMLVYPQPAAKAGAERKIRIELTEEARKQNPHAHVRARSGYYVPKS